MSSDRNHLVARRPAEAATPVAMAIALLVCKLVGVDDAYTVGYVAIVVSFVPAAVTWTVVLIRKKGEVSAQDSQAAQSTSTRR